MTAEAQKKRIALIDKHIGEFKDFPKPGIVFKDLFTALTHGDVCVAVKELFITHIKDSCSDVEAVVGLESRGFLFSLLIAAEMGIACVPVRKKGKLPGECVSQQYALEYGTDTFEMQKGAIKAGQKVLIVDDLMATGGTLEAAKKLVQSQGGVVVECLVLLEIPFLNGRAKLQTTKVTSFIQCD